MKRPMVDWSLLPSDLLVDIALKLDELEDFVYFSIVCHSWNSASLWVKSKWNPRIPWLLLAENTNDNPDCLRKLYNPSKKRCYTVKAPQTFGARCWGSSCGWVVVFNLNLNLYLFNPLTKAQISLPPWTTLPSQIEYESDNDDENLWFRKSFIRRAIVCRTADDDLLVMAIHNYEKMALAYARPGDQAWTSVPTPKKSGGVFDIVNLAGKIIMLYCDHSLGCWDPSRGACNFEPVPYFGAPHDILHENPWKFFKLYLVESFGDLFMVLRHKAYVKDANNPIEPNEEMPYKTSHFEVFRLNIHGKEWERVKNLGDVAFFVGDNYSMSAIAGNYKPNCIYFTDDEIQFLAWPIAFGGYDMGVFDMVSKSIETFYEGDDMRSEFCTPLWFMPELS